MWRAVLSTLLRAERAQLDCRVCLVPTASLLVEVRATRTASHTVTAPLPPRRGGRRSVHGQQQIARTFKQIKAALGLHALHQIFPIDKCS